MSELTTLREASYNRDGVTILKILHDSEDPIVKKSATRAFKKTYRTQKEIAKLFNQYAIEYPKDCMFFARPLISHWKRFTSPNTWRSSDSDAIMLKVLATNSKTPLFKMLDRYVDTWDPKKVRDDYDCWTHKLSYGEVNIHYGRNDEDYSVNMFIDTRIHFHITMSPGGTKLRTCYPDIKNPYEPINRNHMKAIKELLEDQMGFDAAELIKTAQSRYDDAQEYARKIAQRYY